MSTALHDKDIREPLFEFLETSYGKVRIIEEKTMGRSRADVVMVLSECLVGIEIKSDADTYQRLAGQIKDYDRYYDYNIVVVGTTHALHIGEHVPAHWGIITVEYVDERFDFYFLKKPEPNPNIKLSKKLEILWRPELAIIQERTGMPKYKEKSKSFVIKKIEEAVPSKISLSQLNAHISDILFERDYNTVKETLAEYRKSELQKAIDTEDDPRKKLELIMEKASRKKAFRKRKKRF